MTEKRTPRYRLAAIKAAFAVVEGLNRTYKPSIDGMLLYVKFTVNAQQELLLISFKEA